MTTPIFDFIKKYADSNTLRLHMPGHKGIGFLGFEKSDITEIDGAYVLYSAGGIIRQSEENAAALFGTEKTVYSAEGSSLAIRAMLYLVKIYAEAAGKKPLIAAGRNAHKTFVTACGLLELDVKWLCPKLCETVISCDITAGFLEAFLNESEEKPAAVYITGPDYLGNIPDIGALAEICRRHGVLLLVDNAHGAYLKFLPEDRHPISLGADMCCDSAHKTLPALTGGAYLHISRNAPEFFAEQAQRAMAVFASTSPSYLILQSLDQTNKYLASDYPKRLAEFIKEVQTFKHELEAAGYRLIGDEPLKLTIAPKTFGYTGDELAGILSNEKIVCEFSDSDYIVLMLTPEIGKEGLDRVRQVLTAVQKREAVLEKPPAVPVGKQRMSIKKALFSPSEELDVKDCLGRIAAQAAVNCPPAIPIVVCGEEIDSEAIRSFGYYGIEKCCVVKEGSE